MLSPGLHADSAWRALAVTRSFGSLTQPSAAPRPDLLPLHGTRGLPAFARCGRGCAGGWARDDEGGHVPRTSYRARETGTYSHDVPVASHRGRRSRYGCWNGGVAHPVCPYGGLPQARPLSPACFSLSLYVSARDMGRAGGHVGTQAPPNMDIEDLPCPPFTSGTEPDAER